MKVSQAVIIFLDYQKINSKKCTIKYYTFLLSRFNVQFADRKLGSIAPDEILSFLTSVNEHTKQTTRTLRYGILNGFYNFIKNTYEETLQNPCNSQMLKKVFRAQKSIPWTILDKETVDEIIFRTEKIRNRLMLELMARGGMRIGEVLKIRPVDVVDRKITLHNPKSGKEVEAVFIPQKIANRLKDYIRTNKIDPHERIFPLQYGSARDVVKNAGKLAGINLKPHDLRRHAATYASRSGTPIEIVSKVILRHSNLSTTQRYLGKVSDSEAVKWIENLYG